MPTATNDGVELYYETAGTGGGTNAEPGGSVAFVPDLGCGAWLWSWQAPALAGPREVITWDLRGTGRSSEAREYSIAAMASDLDAVLADHGVRSAAVVGAGMGGLVALAATLRGSRVDRLALLGTAADGAAFDAAAFLAGPEDLSGLTSAGFREAYPEEVERITDWRRREDAPEDIRREHARAIAAFDLSDRLHEITAPALVAHGEADAVVLPEAARDLAAGLPRGRFEGFAEGSHLFFVEQARLVSDAIAGFLDGE